MQDIRPRRLLNAVLAGTLVAVAAATYAAADDAPLGTTLGRPDSLLPAPASAPPGIAMDGSPSHAPSRGSASVRTPIGPWLGESTTSSAPEPTSHDWPTRADIDTADESPAPTEPVTPSLEPPIAVADPPQPPPPTAMSASCAAVPSEPAGWTRRVTSTFDETTALGAWPGPAAARDWFARQAGASDSSGRGTYDAGRTVTEHDGVVDVFIHSEGDTRYVAALVAVIGDTVGQRITICMRADRIPGYKLAFLLWPSQGDGNDRGEIDFPEGKFEIGATAHAFMHYDGAAAQDGWDTGVSTADWHVYTIEWNPGSAASQSDDVCAFYLDGQLVGRSTGAPVPDVPMHYVMQMETFLAGQALPAPASGHVLIDWITIATPG